MNRINNNEIFIIFLLVQCLNNIFETGDKIYLNFRYKLKFEIKGLVDK